MKYSKIAKAALLLITSGLFTINASADIKINVGEGVNLVAANGKELNPDSLFSSSRNISLPNGINQILVTYTAEVKKGNEYELEHSNAFVLLIEGKDQALSLSVPEIKRMNDLEKFEESMNWLLTDSSGRKFPYKVSMIKREGFQLSRDYEEELEELNESSAEAALPKSQIFSNAMINKNTESADTTNKSMAAQMLIYWYNQADEKTRKSFKELVNNQ